MHGYFFVWVRISAEVEVETSSVEDEEERAPSSSTLLLSTPTSALTEKRQYALDFIVVM